MQEGCDKRILAGRVSESCLSAQQLPLRMQFANEELAAAAQHACSFGEDWFEVFDVFENQHRDDDLC